MSGNQIQSTTLGHTEEMSSKKAPIFTSPHPSYAFHGSNSSHSKDNGSGGRTYHIPNYATRSENTYSSFSGRRPQTESGTSYANERSRLISVSLDEDKGTKKVIVAVVFMFLAFVAVPLSLLALKAAQSPGTSDIDWWALRNELNERLRDQTGGPEEWRRHKNVLERSHAETERHEKHRQQELETSGSLKQGITEKRPTKQNRRTSTENRNWPMYWDDPQQGDSCLGYGSREYTARLWNVPLFADWMLACQTTEIEIQGTAYRRPTYCESRWPFGGLYGHWAVNTSQSDCRPYWGSLHHDGCVAKGSRLRRISSRLWKIQSGEDWMKMCSTTPATILGIHFDKPTLCDYRGIWGIYGIWEIEDQNC